MTLLGVSSLNASSTLTIISSTAVLLGHHLLAEQMITSWPHVNTMDLRIKTGTLFTQFYFVPFLTKFQGTIQFLQLIMVIAAVVTFKKQVQKKFQTV